MKFLAPIVSTNFSLQPRGLGQTLQLASRSSKITFLIKQVYSQRSALSGGTVDVPDAGLVYVVACLDLQKVISVGPKPSLLNSLTDMGSRGSAGSADNYALLIKPSENTSSDG